MNSMPLDMRRAPVDSWTPRITGLGVIQPIRSRAPLSSTMSSTMADLAEMVRNWAKDGTLEEEVIELTETRYAFNVTRCRYAEKYRELGMAEFGYCLSCCRDEPFAEGFNQDIRFARRQTIMEGAPYCDFKFFLDT